MKKILIILIYTQVCILALKADGGDDYFRIAAKKIDYFDPTNNFYYIGINDTLYHQTRSFSKKENYITKRILATTGFGIYDFNNNTTTYVHFDTCNIVGFWFEQYYSETEKKIIFNENYVSQIVNNFEIPFRKVSNKLFILTYSYETEKNKLWTCEKDGANLKAITELDSPFDFRIDIFNTTIMTIKIFNKELIIKRWGY
ncbi:MAG: hypothetical protein JXL97_02315 [Bacteroidales bacterium]|nr:hypothetical protein [Bacteroidales bacterium]